MFGATQIQIGSAEEAQNLKREAEAHQRAESEAAAAARPAPSINTATSHTVEILDGHSLSRSGRPTSVTVERPLAMGMARLSNGMVADVDSIKAAGLEGMIVEVAGDSSRPFREQAAKPLPERREFEPGVKEQAKPKSDSGDNQLTGVSEDEKTTITKGHDALAQASEVIGASAVNSMQRAVVASGELPDADSLPAGVTPEMMNSVVAAYTAEANVVLRSVPGASVDALSEMLNDNEMKEARMAAFTGNDGKLKDLAYKAVSRMQNIPDDPATLKSLTAHWPKDYRVLRRNGAWWVTTPKGDISWKDAVATGEIRFAS